MPFTPHVFVHGTAHTGKTMTVLTVLERMSRSHASRGAAPVATTSSSTDGGVASDW